MIIEATLPRKPSIGDNYRECWSLRTDNPSITHNDWISHTGMIEDEFFTMLREFLVGWHRG